MEAIGKGYSSKWGKNSSSEERLKFLYTAYSGTKYTPQKKKVELKVNVASWKKW